MEVSGNIKESGGSGLDGSSRSRHYTHPGWVFHQCIAVQIATTFFSRFKFVSCFLRRDCNHSAKDFGKGTSNQFRVEPADRGKVVFPSILFPS